MPDVTDGVRISIKDFLSLSSVIHDAERDKRRRGPVHPLQARVYSSSSYFFFGQETEGKKHVRRFSLLCLPLLLFLHKKKSFFSLHVDCLVKVNSRVRKKQTGYRHTTPRVSLTIQPFCVGQKKKVVEEFFARERQTLYDDLQPIAVYLATWTSCFTDSLLFPPTIIIVQDSVILTGLLCVFL